MLLFREVAGICTLNNNWYLFGLSRSAKIPGENWCWALLRQNSLGVHECWFGLWQENTRLTPRWSPWWAAGNGSGLSFVVGFCQPSLGTGQHLWWSQPWRHAFSRHFLTDQSAFRTAALGSGFLDSVVKFWAVGCAPSKLVCMKSWCSQWSRRGVVTAAAGKAGWHGVRSGTAISERRTWGRNPIALPLNPLPL